ncbi:hypothetical protein CEXT_527751 [Caerostris extrusa]|uniref:Secreted protein n=1 Tax=Caerostris extrusa TaxID=172846 RepID=A0AAV4S3F1_CAEEX|nr:hypothetical protein CEXT_527751 [Caerostris extrusa]
MEKNSLYVLEFLFGVISVLASTFQRDVQSLVSAIVLRLYDITCDCLEKLSIRVSRLHGRQHYITELLESEIFTLPLLHDLTPT